MKVDGADEDTSAGKDDIANILEEDPDIKRQQILLGFDKVSLHFKSYAYINNYGSFLLNFMSLYVFDAFQINAPVSLGTF